MKRMLMLTTLAALTLGSMGCECCDWMFRRGAAVDACVPSCAPCESCGTCGTCNAGCSSCAAPGVTPGPEIYAPGPAQ